MSAKAEFDFGGARVLVTGGSGRIGSELCRQIRDLKPTSLIIVDQSEIGVFTIADGKVIRPQRDLMPPIPTRQNRSFLTAMTALDDVVMGMIQERRRFINWIVACCFHHEIIL